MAAIAESMPQVEIIDPKVAPIESIRAKANSKFSGDFNRVMNVSRAAFVTTAEADFKTLVKLFRAAKKSGWSTV